MTQTDEIGAHFHEACAESADPGPVIAGHIILGTPDEFGSRFLKYIPPEDISGGLTAPYRNLGSFLLGASGSVMARVYSLPGSQPSHSISVGRFCTCRI